MAYFVAFLVFFLALSTSSLACDLNSDNCSDINSNFTLCETFVDGIDLTPSSQCCDSLNNLNFIAREESGGAQRICQCIENMANNGEHPRYIESRITDLYSYCQVNLSFPISEHMNCSRYITYFNML